MQETAAGTKMNKFVLLGQGKMKQIVQLGINIHHARCHQGRGCLWQVSLVTAAAARCWLYLVFLACVFVSLTKRLHFVAGGLQTVG